jgi:hypothetical protein
MWRVGLGGFVKLVLLRVMNHYAAKGLQIKKSPRCMFMLHLLYLYTQMATMRGMMCWRASGSHSLPTSIQWRVSPAPSAAAHALGCL